MTITDLEALLQTAHKAVDLAHDLLLAEEAGALTPKGDRDFSSALDYKIEAAVRERLAKLTPDLGFLGEERGFSGGAESASWVLDPIDGTANFVREIPLCAVSLGLIQDERPILGVIDLPFLGSRYSATDGQGAYQDRKRLSVGNTKRLRDAIVAIGDYAVGEGANDKNRSRIRLTEQLAAAALRVRMTGSAALDLAWLASGRIDASITLSNNPWDMAAGAIIAREAGAVVADLDGSSYTLASRATVAFSPALGPSLLDLISKAVTTPSR